LSFLTAWAEFLSVTFVLVSSNFSILTFVDYLAFDLGLGYVMC